MPLAVLAGFLVVPSLLAPSLAGNVMPELVGRGLVALVPLALLAAALGLGLAVRRVLGAHASGLGVALALGVALLLVLLLAGGALGQLLLSGALLCAGGIAGLVWCRRETWEQVRERWWGIGAATHDVQHAPLDTLARVLLGFAWCVASGMLALACSLPGLLWPSEFGGYDSLSYHLPLAIEWAGSDRVWPSPNNVYSYLPSGLEAAFAWQASLLSELGLHAQGQAFFAAQQLHALLAIASALAIGGACRALVQRLGAGPTQARLAGASGALFAMAMPWLIVVGTLSYNECGVVLALAACVRVLLSQREAPQAGGAILQPVRMVVVLAMLVGGACASKPTAIIMLGVPIALCLVVLLRPAQLLRSGAVGILVGSAMLAPWMLRNASASGNPVFPFAAGVFARADGSMGHWNTEQVQRFAAGHRFGGTATERLKLLVQADPRDPMGTQHRGLRHPQWGEALLLALGACVLLGMRCLAAPGLSGRQRGLFVAIALMLPLQVLLWLLTTHVQSRFLLPCLVPACVALGCVVAGAVRVRPTKVRSERELATRGAALAGVVLLAAWWRAPSAMSISGVPLTQTIAARLSDLLPAVQPGFAPDAPPARAEAVVAALPAGTKVLLLGDATPLYFPAERIAWSTTWDESPIVRAGGLQGLRTLGFSHVLINFGELARLQRSGFLDPRIDPDAVLREAQELNRAGVVPVGVWMRGAQVLLPLEK